MRTQKKNKKKKIKEQIRLAEETENYIGHRSIEFILRFVNKEAKTSKRNGRKGKDDM